MAKFISIKTDGGDVLLNGDACAGIKKIVDNVSQGLNIPCGCSQRKDYLNKMFPGK